MSTKPATRDVSRELSVSPEFALQRFQDMAMLIPETESDGGASFIMDIMNAQSAADLDANWAEKDSEKMVGVELQFEGVTRSVSDFSDGLGVFLVVKATDTKTGEPVTFTTGSSNVVAQLVKAYTESWFPFQGVIVKSIKASKAGYYPQHIQIAR